jgi:hypothetical protein
MIMSYYTKYEGNIKDLKIIFPKKELLNADWNKCLPVPVVEEYTVYVHPDQSNTSNNYIQVIHGGELAVSTFSRTHFK